MITGWSRLMEQAMGAWGSQKVRLGFVAGVILLVWWVHGWAKEEFVTRDEFSELRTIFVEYIDDSRIEDAKKYIRDKQLALQLAEATNEPESHIATLKGQIKQAEKYRDCLINEEPNCKHHKPPE